ncbi:MAG: type III PLP-dependent enzyme, partial [Pseudomonadota bacterium]
MRTFSSTLKKSDQPEVLFDTHPEISLDFKHVQNELRKGYQRPFLLVDSHIIRQKTRRFKAVLPRVHPHYAVKANPDHR